MSELLIELIVLKHITCHTQWRAIVRRYLCDRATKSM